MSEDIQCKICKCEICQGTLHNKPKNYKGSDNPKVIIIGHSPTVRSKQQAYVVLNMDKIDGALYKYINNNILVPLTLTPEDIYCTNLIKCYTDGLPEDIDKKNKGYITGIFENCSKHLEEEILTINPKLIISLSERVYEILLEKYNGKKGKLKDNFAVLNKLRIRDKEFPYVPLVHIPKYKKVESHYFPEQTYRLSRLGKELKL